MRRRGRLRRNDRVRQAASGSFDLVVADLMLPDTNGLEIFKALRARPDHTPILVLTAKSGELDRVSVWRSERTIT